MPTFPRRMRYGIFLVFLVFTTTTCSQKYNNLSDPYDQQAIIQQANDFLTSGDCNDALQILRPLVQSIYSTHEARLVYASAYACLAGFNFLNLITALTNNTSADIWSLLVKLDFSATANDDKTLNLQNAAAVLWSDTTESSSFDAVFRPADTNLYMVLIQALIISTTISKNTMGAADPTTGNSTQSIVFPGAFSGTAQDQCNLSVAISTIDDSLNNTTVAGGLTTIQSDTATICAALSGGCTADLNPNDCSAPGSTEETDGQLVENGIAAEWQ